MRVPYFRKPPYVTMKDETQGRKPQRTLNVLKPCDLSSPEGPNIVLCVCVYIYIYILYIYYIYIYTLSIYIYIVYIYYINIYIYINK